METKWRKIIKKQEKEIERLRLELQVWKEKASLDRMTGVLNKCEGLKKLQEDMEECYHLGQKLTIAFIDIDHMKKINDELGHCAGDRLLKKVTGVLKKNIRKRDYIFRFGGDEFVIVFSHTTMKEAKKICNRIQKGICQYNVNETTTVSISFSTGFYEYRNKVKTTPEEIIQLADKRMYEKKKQKRQNPTISRGFRIKN